MKTTTINLYEFDELEEKAKNKARQWHNNNNAEEWWQNIYEDASNVGIDINDKLTESVDVVLDLILREHGADTKTHMIASHYSKELKNLPDVESPDYDELLDNLKEEFTKKILECYFDMLRAEYDYINSNEYIDEQIKINKYTFEFDGTRRD